MTWIKLDDKAPRHPKVASLSDRAFRWWVRGLCYASEFLTNGVLHPVFWKQVPKGDRAELSGNRLWDWIDPNFIIHDYLSHQSSKEDVEADKQRNREKQTAYRERRREERRKGDQDVTGNVTGYVTDTRNRLVTGPENREQRTDTENREQTTPKERGGGLIVSPLQFARLQETHSFVGAKLRVPNALHSELIAKSGANADVELRKWYARLDEELELSGTGTGDVFAWLRPRHQAFGIEKGWIEPAPKASRIPQTFTDEAALDAKLAAIEARGKR